jgi:hypothetical protein
VFAVAGFSGTRFRGIHQATVRGIQTGLRDRAHRVGGLIEIFDLNQLKAVRQAEATKSWCDNSAKG